MKVGKHRICAFEVEPGMDEKIGFSTHGPQSSAQHGRFNRSHACRADADAAFGCAHQLGIGLRHFIAFVVQFDVRDEFRSQRGECSQANVQRHVSYLRSRLAAFIEDLGREVQAGRGRRYRPALFGENSLIAGFIGEFRFAMDIGRQRSFAHSLDQVFNRLFGSEAYAAFAKIAVGQYFGAEMGREQNDVALTDTLAGPHHAVPFALVGIQGASEKNFNLGAVGVIAPAMQARRKDARVVENDTISRFDETRKTAEEVVLKSAVLFREHQHARSAAVG